MKVTPPATTTRDCLNGAAMASREPTIVTASRSRSLRSDEVVVALSPYSKTAGQDTNYFNKPAIDEEKAGKRSL